MQTLIIENSSDGHDDVPSYSLIPLDDEFRKFIEEKFKAFESVQDTNLLRMTFSALGYGFCCDAGDNENEWEWTEGPTDANGRTPDCWIVEHSWPLHGGDNERSLDIFNIVVCENSFYVQASVRHASYFFESREVSLPDLNHEPVVLGAE